VPKSLIFASSLLLFCWGAAALSFPQDAPGSPDRWQPPADPLLRQSLAALERGLSQQNLLILTRLLPYEEKVLVRWDHPMRQDGVFTGSQVLMLLRELFQQYRTEQFTVKSGALLPPGSLYHCMGRWVLRASGGPSQSIELHFSLKRESGVWTIRELRQTR
jgi:hypothetical protein